MSACFLSSRQTLERKVMDCLSVRLSINESRILWMFDMDCLFSLLFGILGEKIGGFLKTCQPPNFERGGRQGRRAHIFVLFFVITSYSTTCIYDTIGAILHLCALKMRMEPLLFADENDPEWAFSKRKGV